MSSTPSPEEGRNIVTPWGPVGYLTYKRTYARDGEEFPQTIERILRACSTQLKLDFTKAEEKFAREMMLKLKGIVAGRFMWQLGTRTVKDLGLASLQNCSFTVVNEPIRPFTWTMDMLMLGAGVGYNIQREYVYELPKAKRAKVTRREEKDADFIVPDSREGWVELLRRVLLAHFTTGRGFSYSTICVRSKGSPIKGFGGTASGPEVLCYGVSQISEVINKRAGKKLRPIDCLDIMNVIGHIVVAGNVRRSAQIAIGDADDVQYLNAKRWDRGNIPNWRAMSNNSVVCNDIEHLPDAFWEGYKGNGEPYGLINLRAARAMGRTGETFYPDPNVCGMNPCGEQPLEPWETCCLSEVFLPNVTNYEEFTAILQVLYRINKHSLRLKCHHSETQEIVHKNMRMGISVTGYLQASKEQKEWLLVGYEHLRDFDIVYSHDKGWPESIKLTTVKPSGTLSLLAGVTPGCHPGYSRYHIRRIRVASNSPLIETLKKAGYPMEPVQNIDGTLDRNTLVVEFPSEFPADTVVEADVSAVTQLEVVKELQKNWSDNSVSCTVYYALEELEHVKSWLKANYNSSVKSCSFLLRRDHGFAQAPLESITKEEYEKRSKMLNKITESVQFNECDIVSGIEECQEGNCPIK